MKIEFYQSGERCKECGGYLYARQYGKGWLWMCLHCLKLW
ncbi:unnamed protein product, partial [marine sediment metagenome]